MRPWNWRRKNRRVNESLYRNGKITRDLVFRAEADQLEVQQSQLGAQNAERLAQSYVNLIRNAPFDRVLPSGGGGRSGHRPAAQ